VSDARWLEVEKAVASAVANFDQAVDFAHHEAFRRGDLIGSALRMGFMHAVQAGHTSLENALLRILSLLEEEPPSGESWHADLISRVRQPLGNRPAVLPPELAEWADETRRFRNRATRAYDNFDADRATETLAAAERLARSLPETIARFRQAIDP